MRRSTRLALVLLAPTLLAARAAWAGGSRLLVLDRPARGSASISYWSVDPLAGLATGGPGGRDELSASFLIQYRGIATEFVVPAGAWDGRAGWRSNDGVHATFHNRQAPDGPSPARVASIVQSTQARFLGRSLGDPALAIGGPTFSGPIFVAFLLDNGGSVVRHCVSFAESECARTPIGHGTGWKLRCRGGGADPTCRAVPPTTLPPTTTVTTSTSTTTISPTCGDGVRDPGEECDGSNLCTESCGQSIPSCCLFADHCNPAPLFSLSYYLYQWCGGPASGAQPIGGGLCAADGTCTVQAIPTVSACCQRHDGSCWDEQASSTGDLWHVNNYCVAGFALGDVVINATCGPGGTCVRN